MKSKTFSAGILPAFVMTTMIFGGFSCKQNTEFLQPELGARSVKILDQDGYQFKDLNKNGELDRYEDWRLSADERSGDLLSKMSVDEKAGFMLINSLNMVGTRAAEESGGKLTASDLSETGSGGFAGAGGPGMNRPGNQENGRRQETRGPAGARPQDAGGAYLANLSRSAGTSKMVKEFHNRHFILRANESARITAEWANKLQELCESEPLGIPAILASNPRNHITANASLGTSVGTTVFTSWPGELGLSAMRDLDLVHEFADDSRQEWVAVGLRKGYMYMADLATEPRWSRVNGTFGENSEWVAGMIREIVTGFQGEKLNSGSVALTTKHFPGGGSGKKGQDSHFEWGKAEVYPGGMFKNNLIPFKAAIDAGTSAIMPYYSLPEDTEYEEVGYAFNKGVINDLLRNQLGFKGIINSDTGPLTSMPWGVENLTKEERYVKAIEAGVNIFSGESDPAMLINIINKGSVNIALIDSSVHRLLKEKFQLGLFENPYVEPEEAQRIADDPASQALADEAHRKSVVLLRNSGILPLAEGKKVYVEVFSGNNSEATTKAFRDVVGTSAAVVDELSDADAALVWVMPSNFQISAEKGMSITLNKDTGIDVAKIKSIESKVPTVLIINLVNPWVINEIEPDAAAVLTTFGIKGEALLDVVYGRFKPTGKLPLTIPKNQEAVEKNASDVPGFAENFDYAYTNADGNKYVFGFGISY